MLKSICDDEYGSDEDENESSVFLPVQIIQSSAPLIWPCNVVRLTRGECLTIGPAGENSECLPIAVV